ncbi:alpha/beta fold hydrolase [Thalassolituus sp.]|uniref:alpha/beta fold hydrolase n=1 Tax=Thalassolituus sp. TaxID=2030822 RepID=UPI00351191DB
MNFSTYSPAALKSAPSIQMVGEYKVEFLAYESPDNMDKAPVMFLGGAFQSFSSFRNEVEQILEHCPVILADFPSQGSNDQLAPDLDMEDYADLIAGFLTSQNVRKVQLMGVSYGSAMATLFASKYPELIERLLISGITCFRRESLITLLEDSLKLLETGDMDAFATTAVCNLINHNRMEETNIGATYRRLLFRQIARLNDNERMRYAQNTRRLLRFEGFPAFPVCETLIATGEYDNFTLPQENAAVARQCPNGTFAVIRNADHLAQFEQKSASMEVVCRFMTGQPLEGIPGVDIYDPQAFDFANQRLQARLRPMEQPYTLVDKATGKSHTVRMLNINFSGCELEQIHVDMALTEASDELYLELPETGHTYHVRVLAKDKKRMRCLIMQRDIKAAESLLSYLKEHLLMIRDNQPAVEEVAGRLA